jgi:hypothetical protein
VKHEVPPRGAAFNGRPMILNFDVDCGELIPGHHFVARGLGGPVRLSIADHWDGDSDEDGDTGDYEQMLELEEAGGYPGFSLEYELVPGVSAAEAVGDGAFFRFLVGVGYDADVKLPWYPNDGGAIAPFEGGSATHGSRGDWPLPPGASILTFSLSGVNADGFADRENPAGDLVVDVVRGNADWHPR